MKKLVLTLFMVVFALISAATAFACPKCDGKTGIFNGLASAFRGDKRCDACTVKRSRQDCSAKKKGTEICPKN